MSFRGVLLTFTPDHGAEERFQTVCLEAHMSIYMPPSSDAPSSSSALKTERKVVVTDGVTEHLLQVTHLSGLLPQRETNSVLWIVTIDEKAKCFCFQFTSSIDYGYLEEAVHAWQRLQQYVMVETSTQLEIDAQKELTRTDAKPEPIKEEQVMLAAKNGRSQVPTKCILCSLLESECKSQFAKHPFVLKDGWGNDVFVCKICLQAILKKRVQKQMESTDPVVQNSVCGVCSDPTDTTARKAVKKCSHPQCIAAYCTTCLYKLIGKANIDRVRKNKSWQCPNCAGSETVVDDERPVDKENQTNNNSTEDIVQEIPLPDSDEETQALPPVNESMGLLDYFASYVEYLTGREAVNDVSESEDVCYCCKDGGDVIECDWNGMNGGFGKCPKVYHEDCLGYTVPEEGVWRCPRHRCQQCGVVALYSCRFCVTSYCKAHVPKDITQLGGGTPDITTSTYILCATCTDRVDAAKSENKLSDAVYKQVYEVGGKKRRRK